ncbi:hypothetical protein HY637_02710 [Candidatus Woesearchaeota archaeon]|nr:hypothetical protein [Candidatus Woesearchaeota archaeon]
MALSDYIPFSLPSGFSFEYIATIGGAVLALGVGVAVIIALRNRSDDFGTTGEKSEINLAGLWRYRRLLRQIQKLETRAKNAEKALRKAEKGEEGAAASKSEQRADQAVEQGAKAAELEAKAEEDTTAVEGRVLGIEASLKEILRAIIEYAHRKGNNVVGQERQAKVLEEVLRKIENIVSHPDIDSTILPYLEEFLQQLTAAFSQDAALEKDKEKAISELVRKARQPVRVMKRSISGAKRKLRKLRSARRKTQRSFKKEFSKEIFSLNAKRKELKLLKRTKDADPSIIASLEAETSLMKQQMGEMQQIYRQLRIASAFVRKGSRQMKSLLQYVIRNEKDLARFEKALEERKKQIKNRSRKLEDAVGNMSRLIGFEGRDPHKLVLDLSREMRLYFGAYVEILNNDIEFDNIVKSITAKEFVISQQMEAFQQIAIAVTESEKAVENGIGAITELVKAITGEGSKRNIDYIAQQLRNAMKILDYQKGIEAFMKRLAWTMKVKSRQVNAQMQEIINEDAKLLAQVQAEEQSNSEYLASLIATAVRQKINVEKTYMKPAVAFGQELEKANNKVANAYNAGVRIEQMAAAS